MPVFAIPIFKNYDRTMARQRLPRSLQHMVFGTFHVDFHEADPSILNRPELIESDCFHDRGRVEFTN